MGERTANGHDTTGTRVLVVEDYDELLSLYARWLTPEYEVLQVQYRDEAIPRVGAADVVLIDRKLGAAAGEELVAELRGHGVDSPIALLGYREPGPDHLTLSIDACAEKPLRRDELRALVAELDERRALSERARERRAVESRLEAVEASVPARSLVDDPRYERARERLHRLAAAHERHPAGD